MARKKAVQNGHGSGMITTKTFFSFIFNCCPVTAQAMGELVTGERVFEWEAHFWTKTENIAGDLMT